MPELLHVVRPGVSRGTVSYTHLDVYKRQDDDPVKKNPYLQTSTRAMLKEVVEVVFNNIDSNTDITVDFRCV